MGVLPIRRNTFCDRIAWNWTKWTRQHAVMYIRKMDIPGKTYIIMITATSLHNSNELTDLTFRAENGQTAVTPAVGALDDRINFGLSALGLGYLFMFTS